MPRLSHLSLSTAYDDMSDDDRSTGLANTMFDFEIDVRNEIDPIDLCDEIADGGKAGWGRKVLGRALRMTIEQELWKRKGA